MRAEYEITFEDFVAAVAAHGSVQKHAGAAPRKRRWAWIVLAAFSFGVLLLTAFATRRDDWSFHRTDLTRAATRWGEAMPWVSWCIVIALYRCAIRSKHRHAKTIMLIGAAIVLPLAAVTMWFREDPPMIAWIGWIAVFTIWGTLWRIIAGQSLKAQWAMQAHLHGPRILATFENGFSIADAISQTAYDWAAVRNWSESGELFLLYITEASFHIVPKRAFSPADVDAFRQLLESASDRKRGFQVIPTANLAKPATK